MTADPRQIDREAADWFLLLNEEPDDAALKERLDGWLDADPAHVDAWGRISYAGTALASASPEQWDRVAPAHRPRPAPRQRSAPRRWAGHLRPRFIAGVAASAAVAIAILPSASLWLQSDHMTGTAQVENIALADGSTVHLGPDSAIAVDYASGQREVRLLAGRAWFDVAPDPARPFRVTTDKVSTTVLGTGFEVDRSGSSTKVAVEHGRVRVNSGGSFTMQRDLIAGQWARIGSDHAMRYGTDRPDLMGAWRQGRLLVRDRRIADVIEELRPWYSGRIVLADSAIGQRRVTGYYDLRDPAVTLESLLHPTGGRIIYVTRWIMIVTG